MNAINTSLDSCLQPIILNSELSAEVLLLARVSISCILLFCTYQRGLFIFCQGGMFSHRAVLGRKVVEADLAEHPLHSRKVFALLSMMGLA